MRVNATVFDWDGVVGGRSIVNSGSVVSIFAICRLIAFAVLPASSVALAQTVALGYSDSKVKVNVSVALLLGF